VVARYLADGATGIEDLERALAWDRGNPELHLRLAQAYQTLLDEPDLDRARYHLEAALRLRPSHANTWLRLALLADRQGNRDQARRALETALRYAPHSISIRWESGLLAHRWGEREWALEHFRYVLSNDPERRETAFHLARALLGSAESVATLLPSEREPLTGILDMAVRRRDLSLARIAWERREALKPPVPATLQREYLELLIDQGQGGDARRLWLRMVPNGHLTGAPGNLIWDGGFESGKLPGWGLGWRANGVWGVEVGFDRRIVAQGQQSLRLVFNSHSTLDYDGVSQLVPVDPGREYRFRVLARAADFKARPGLKLQIVSAADDQVLAETAEISDTTADWISLEAPLRVPDRTSLVRVRVRRERGLQYGGELKGRVWLDEASLVPTGRGGRS
jgi:hypothetical protein